MLTELKKDFERLKNDEKAELLQRFFKTGKGEYGEGDIFLGIMVPEQRKLAKKYSQLILKDIQELISSRVHEQRLTALFILIDKYKKANKENDKKLKKEIFEFYLRNTPNINNWDLIDLSAPNIIGNYLLDKDKKILYKLAKSPSIWERRIAILATFWFIRENQFKDSLQIAKLLLKDKHDLIHKAVGWMLREIGKRDKKNEETFLLKYHKVMPRTMLRYAIEKFSEKERKKYLNKKI